AQFLANLGAGGLPRLRLRLSQHISADARARRHAAGHAGRPQIRQGRAQGAGEGGGMVRPRRRPHRRHGRPHRPRQRGDQERPDPDGLHRSHRQRHRASDRARPQQDAQIPSCRRTGVARRLRRRQATAHHRGHRRERDRHAMVGRFLDQGLWPEPRHHDHHRLEIQKLREWARRSFDFSFEVPMRASLLSGKSAFRRIRLRAVLIGLLAFPVLLLPMSNAFAQREIVEMNNQVIRLYQSGQKTEAIALAERSVEKSRATLGADNKITGTLLSQLGNFYREVGRFADAEKTLKTAVAILERNGASANLELAGALNNLGGVYLNQEMYPETEALFKRSLAVAEKLPAGKMRDYQRGNSMNSLAVVYGNQANVM